MAAKNINKINSMSLFGLAQRLPTTPYSGCASHRYVTSFKQLKKPITEPDYSKFISKNSAISLINEERSRKSMPTEKRLETHLAAEQVRKCNEILKEHYLQRRKLQEKILSGVDIQEPTLSKKLKDLMAHEAVSSTKNHYKVENLRRFNGMENNRCLVDCRPQTSGFVRRWHMRIPARMLSEYDQKHLSELDMTILSKRGRKVDKIVKPPEKKHQATPSPNKSNEPENKLFMENSKNQRMWQIGSRKIPRLD
ncbi:uncharacterized protein [Drosophila virilis]|uniref:Uncharacterized protein n=1 Tax=Drosophila virilis TaxID=7244 RepID=A0A0Q9W978_DROVI|nr:uncharacterized protein LOC26530728 [Drosophila virilis]KRF80966.1 uncharacterized protein Dvir_GJ25958 [Drosophila virilis]